MRGRESSRTLPLVKPCPLLGPRRAQISEPPGRVRIALRPHYGWHFPPSSSTKTPPKSRPYPPDHPLCSPSVPDQAPLPKGLSRTRRHSPRSTPIHATVLGARPKSCVEGRRQLRAREPATCGPRAHPKFRRQLSNGQPAFPNRALGPMIIAHVSMLSSCT